MAKKKVVVFAGTRPEAIKVISVVQALRAAPDDFDVCLCSVGQHREMLMQAFADFGVTPDASLDVMSQNQSLAGLSARLFTAIDEFLAAQSPDIILVQGDTMTVQVAALTAFYRRIRVGHIEAGLRSHDMAAPFPEELNRRVASLVTDLHFAPTELSKKNLLAEQVPAEQIFVTGNTVVDALYLMLERLKNEHVELPERVEAALAEGRRIVLVTGHRRESFGPGFENICTALRTIAEAHPDVRIVYPVHMNPKVREVVNRVLSDQPGVYLEEPLTYKPFQRLMAASHIILTDSGGIQEEGPALGKPVLVMRDVTERPEGVESGVNKLVGTDVATIVRETARLLDDPAAYQAMSAGKNPFGDGTAGAQIVAILKSKFAQL
ncbi:MULTISPECIES: UDP-N-acetylglucosamine 2-epimerase (non-hydrolyzing) [unclassified Paraburkholderia]|uniref:non-hydrolyzing UDP-N-acetylglucosamine 2-epimerase n=1 Tax=unclassified Paraburkholderia TaxID=2615204 RepID=UPI000E25A57A|nr:MULTISPECIES: UDP-N-acetylglucosamine 2-epimerase (non-hydrolyzing) [unclassified Paraburkholderia]REE20126.1 UDP-N-acetylglucosamine 2-epimerase [Paraburkholderia sp. BL27I4N3]RKR42920.1 UDP-N-acetylglucosamine 2-epimerase [Paraburkholderia sp. BL17N1]